MNVIKQLVYVKLNFIFYDYKNDIDEFSDSFVPFTGTFSLVVHIPSFGSLTVTVRAGSRLPKLSKMLITAEMSTKAQK